MIVGLPEIFVEAQTHAHICALLEQRVLNAWMQQAQKESETYLSMQKLAEGDGLGQKEST
jgi:hypothetical protein